ncbi:MAG: UDP-galactopyranose mutase [Bacteroides sp.]|nr:UDP-galactopyranose mutase [Bacillota bacterium]MCM1394364.1 UDP-galactopyranose mutase [[Eubacterium] siraeum]MCM1456040.1 UDP-galactopyranose mutase [Bacteroides sp.]
MHYDYLIVGAGLTGAVFAREMTDAGKRCLVIDKRGHIAGNIYTEKTEGIDVHKYGAHIFHTNSDEVWNYVLRFAKFNDFINSPIADYKGERYNLPFNMNTFEQMWGVKTPEEAKAKIAEQIADLDIGEPQNLEEQALKMVGRDIYVKLVKGYTEKQWGRDCKDLPASIIKRLPLRFVYDNNYFNAKYQGIPIDGYTAMVAKMLSGIEVRLNTEYSDFKRTSTDEFDKVLYTGKIDEFFDYSEGKLEYRTILLEEKTLDTDDFQGNAVVNYTDRETPYTRIIEHKHFAFNKSPKTVVSYEYPSEWTEGSEAYYPINDDKNTALYAKYRDKLAGVEGVILGGRLGEYKYYDMDKVIERALELAREEKRAAL